MAKSADERMTKAQLIEQVQALRRQVAELQQETGKTEWDLLVHEGSLLRSLMDNSPDYVFFKDRQSRFIMTNDAHAQLLLGLDSAQDAIGKTDFDLFPQEDAQRFFDEEQMIMESGQPVVAREWSLQSQTTGETAWISEHKVPIVDGSGQVIGLVGIARDVTQLKLAEIEREQLLQVLEHRSDQLQTAAKVAQAAGNILSPKELVQTVVDLIRDRFGLYYVGLFLLDDLGNWAVLQAGTGKAGQEQVKKRHRLRLNDRSMIGQCITSGEAVVALDVTQDIAHFKNPLLPDTQSELALPLVSHGRIIGAVTFQASDKEAFSEEDVTILQTMASQVATAIENARLFQQTQETLDEIQAIQRRYVRDGWDRYLKRE